MCTMILILVRPMVQLYGVILVALGLRLVFRAVTKMCSQILTVLNEMGQEFYAKTVSLFPYIP